MGEKFICRNVLALLVLGISIMVAIPLVAAVDDPPTTYLNSPPDNYVNDSMEPVPVLFNCSATDDNSLTNISLFITNSLNQSFSLNQTANISGQWNETIWILNLSNGNYTWNCLAYDNASQSDWGDANRSIIINYTSLPQPTFDFYGYTKYTNSSAMNATNVTIEIYMMVPGQGLTLNSTYSTLSNDSGFFNISGIPFYQNGFYKPVVRHFNDSNNTYVDYIGASLPEFPAFELNRTSPVTFYLKQATTINISAVNASGYPKAFHYQLKDKSLGYPIAINFNTYVTNVLLYVPRDRNYSVMIYPNQSFPVSANIENPSSYYNKTFNITETIERLTGYVSASGVSEFDRISIISYLLEPGRMIYFGENAPAVYNFTGTDEYNFTTGFYNISMIAPAENASMVIMAVAVNGTEYYGGFKEISLSYGVPPAETNITLHKLVGSVSNITVYGASGAQNVTLKQMRFNLLNSSNMSINGFAHLEIRVDYDDYNMTNFTFMTDVSRSANGVFRIPLINVTGIERMNIFTADSAPMKKKYTASELNAAEINITLKDAFSIEDPDGDVLGDLFIDMVKNNEICNVPYYNLANCSLFGGEKNKTEINPLSIVMGGASISFRMKNANNITIHYVNVDLLASGPPDAIFDSNSSSTSNASTFAQAWKFGSTGPEIYEYVIIGIPYTEGNSSQTGFNESAEIKININYLYDDNFNIIWNSSAGDNITDIQNNNTLSDFRDYLNTSYEAYLNGTGVVCDDANTNLSSGLCYKDTTNNMLWFRIPHFSGVGAEPTGSIITETIDGNGGNGGTGGGGGGGIFIPVSSTYIVSDDDFEAGYEKTLSIKDRFKLNISGEWHYVTLANLTNTTATINVTSEVQQATLQVGEEKAFDVNNDTEYDLTVKLNSINEAATKANITVKKYVAPPPEEEREEKICSENWICTEWSACIDGVQTRTCTDQNNCGTEENKPAESQSCVEEEPEAPAPTAPNMLPVLIVIIVVIILIAVFVAKEKKNLF